jgi:hypothetical protein
MDWQEQGLILSVALAAVVLLAWTLSEIKWRRLLLHFGDPRVLGLSHRWTPRVLGAFLLAAALGCISAAFFYRDQKEAESDRPLVTELLLDSEFFDRTHPLSGRYWESLRSAISQIGSQGGVLSLYRSGAQLERVVPATPDRQGLEILCLRHQVLWESSARTPLQESIERLASRAAVDGNRSRLVVLTARSIGEIEKLRQDAAGSGTEEWIFVRLPTVTDAMQYGYRTGSGAWVWQPASAGFPDKSLPVRADDDFWRFNQVLALIAFLCLVAESLLVLWPANVENPF